MERLTLLVLVSSIVVSQCFQNVNLATQSKMILKSQCTRVHPRGQLAVCMASERPDGATEEEIKAAYELYRELKRTNNYAFERNFEFGNPLDIFKPKSNVVDLNSSPFEPLVPLDELMEEDLPQTQSDSAPKASEAMETPKRKAKSLKKSSKISDTSKAVSASGDQEAARQRAEEEAARIKAQLSD